jgi:Rrf2 family protein
MSYSLSYSKAILVVIFISDKVRQGQYEYLSTASIAEILNIPKPTLVQIFQNLSMNGIIQTKEGKHGGIRLMKDPAQITLLDVLEAIEKGKSLFNTSFDLSVQGSRPDNAQSSLIKIFEETEEAMKTKLVQKTIAQILEEMNS